MPKKAPKYCVVTGAAGGIGQSLASVFSEAGYLVIATDHSAKPKGLQCAHYIRADLANLVADQASAKKFLAKVGRLLGGNPLSVLINNAALQILGGVEDLTMEDWNRTLDVNLKAPFLLIQGLLKYFPPGGGAVVNIGSIHSRLTKKEFVAYATSKAALAGMTRAIAVDIGDRVRINAIEPAAIETPMLRAGFQGKEKEYAELASCHPLGRIGKPEEVAHLALILAENDLGFLHGSCIGIDGGIRARLHDPE